MQVKTGASAVASIAFLLVSVTGCASLTSKPVNSTPNPAPAQGSAPAAEAPAPAPGSAAESDAALLAQKAREAAEAPESEPAEEIPEGEPGADEVVESSPLDELEEPPAADAAEVDRENEALRREIPEFDYPVVVNDRVVPYIDYFTGRHREKFAVSLARSGRFVPMIREIFAREGVPQDLLYMAHVESAFKVHAYSRAKAKGIFQFIAGTGRRYGLRIDSWVDERSDPEKASVAAARYLKDLYTMFGDWHLALAAYNAGEGRIQRAMARTKKTDFWSLSALPILKRETRSYVPAILAATVIAKDPSRYGFTIEPDAPLAYDTVTVEGAYDLRVVARLAGADFETIKTLNPAIRRNQTPPSGSVALRLPPGTGESTRAALREMPVSERLVIARHEVRPGDTLGNVAHRYGVSIASIKNGNGLGKRTNLKVGETLVIRSTPGPAPQDADALGTRDGSGRVVYRVRKGDTLGAIARRHGTTPAKIASLSGIGVNSTLHPGQKLVVSGSKAVASTARPAPKAQAPKPASVKPVVHTVRRGENLQRIANRYKVTVDLICQQNNISPEMTLYPGTRLTIRSN